jgi:hypothetical protein
VLKPNDSLVKETIDEKHKWDKILKDVEEEHTKGFASLLNKFKIPFLKS